MMPGALNKQFQSTLPAGGATCLFSGQTPLLMYFNPRSPRGERHDACAGACKAMVISIHAPRGGSDLLVPCLPTVTPIISIHAPRGGSDVDGHSDFEEITISIHAPRGGSDLTR